MSKEKEITKQYKYAYKQGFQHAMQVLQDIFVNLDEMVFNEMELKIKNVLDKQKKQGGDSEQ